MRRDINVELRRDVPNVRVKNPGLLTLKKKKRVGLRWQRAAVRCSNELEEGASLRRSPVGHTGHAIVHVIMKSCSGGLLRPWSSLREAFSSKGRPFKGRVSVETRLLRFSVLGAHQIRDYLLHPEGAATSSVPTDRLSHRFIRTT